MGRTKCSLGPHAVRVFETPGSATTEEERFRFGKYKSMNSVY